MSYRRGNREAARRCALAGLAAAVIVAGGAYAQDSAPPPYPDFTFKRVTVGQGVPGRRITVQIAPRSDAPREAAAPTPPAAEPAVVSTRYPDFWQAVSPRLSDSAPGRLAPAVRALSAGRGVPAPPLRQIRALARAHAADLLVHSVDTQVSPALALAVMAVESGGRAGAVSPKGAVGLMQLMPATAREVGVIDRADPSQNIRGGILYLDRLMTRFGRDPVLVLAAYNAGPGAVERSGGVPPFPETHDFVPRVLAAWTVARALCLTPPELISDGCVFGAMDG